MSLERESRLERSAAAARSLMFVYNTLPVDLATALKRLADWPVSPRASYKILSNREMRFDEAYTDGDQKIVYLSDTTMDELQQGSTHKRFTVAHELGHIFLDHRGVRSRALHGRDFRVQASVSGVGQEEAAADFWAAAFLMPLDLARTCKTPEELAKRTLTSVSAAKIRLEGVARKSRLATKQLRAIPPRTQEALSAFYKEVGAKSRATISEPPIEFKIVVRKEYAILQGFLSAPCKVCGNYELVEEGGCTTCKKCGDSDCC